MKRMSKGEILTVGLMMFSIFFGAGNLIFPPALGQAAGSNSIIAMLGFLVTGVGLPLMGITAIAMQGGKYVPEQVMELFRKRQMTPGLTPRETEVLTHLRDGLTNEAIAERLGVTKDMVKLHLKNIFNKLDVNDRVSAVREAYTRGFLK